VRGSQVKVSAVPLLLGCVVILSTESGGGGKVVGQHDGTPVAAGAAMAGIILLSAWHTRGAQKDYRASHRSIFPVPCESGPMPAMWKPFAGCELD